MTSQLPPDTLLFMLSHWTPRALPAVARYQPPAGDLLVKTMAIIGEVFFHLLLDRLLRRATYDVRLHGQLVPA
jgi:hypothetical protein